MGSWSRGDAIFSLVTRAHFSRAVIMWGGSICENDMFYSFAFMFGGSNIFACDEAYEF